jgi:GNAT superfamily N-acetyltransferase
MIFHHSVNLPGELVQIFDRCFNLISKRYLESIQKKRNFFEWIWGTNEEGKIVCACNLYRYDDMRHVLAFFCVDPDHRKQGIGALFYRYLMNYVPQEYEFSWTCDTDEARAFYRKMGAIENPRKSRYTHFSRYSGTTDDPIKEIANRKSE